MFDFDRLHNLMKEKGRNKTYMCRAIGHADNYLNWLRKNNRTPDTDVIEIWAEILDTTPAYLNGETDIKEKPTDQPVDEQLKRAALAMSRLSPQSREKAISYIDYLLADQEDKP